MRPESVPAGADIGRVLADLGPGVYTLICFVDEPEIGRSFLVEQAQGKKLVR